MSDESLNKAIRSLAFIKVNWDQEKKDYIHSFIPFFATLVCKKHYTSIPSDPNKMTDIIDDFKNEFGLIISFHALISILRQMEKLGLLQKSEIALIPTDKIQQYDFGDKIKIFDRKYENILNSFLSFVEDYKEEISLEDAEKILIAFLKEYDLEIIFISYGKSSLPSVNVEKTEMFLFNKYVEYLESKEPELFQYLVDIAVGHSLSNIINYGEEFNKVSKSSLKDTNLYLDTPFILRLIGAEGEFIKKIYSSLVGDLNKEEVNLYLFPHTNNEINDILQHCISLIDSQRYDPLKAFPVLRYFKELGYKESDVQLFINKVGNTLEKHHIKVKEGPDPNFNIEYQINEEELTKTIIKTYKYTKRQTLKKEIQIYNDVQSISFMHKLRCGGKPNSINMANHIFITTNSRLAYASKMFEQKIYGNGFYIPVTVTDVFLGTIIWIRKPEKMVEESKRRLLARVYGALNPTDELLRQYINEINKLKEKNDISEDDYILLRDSQVAKKMLTEETLGDSDKFTPITPIEILTKIKEELERDAEHELLKEKKEHESTIKKLEAEKIKIQGEEKNKLLEEKKKHERIKEKLEMEKNKIQEEEKNKLLEEKKEHEKIKEKLVNIDKKVERIAKYIAGITIGISIIFIIVSYFILNGYIQIITLVILVIFIIFGILGITIKQIKNKFKGIIKSIIGFT